LKSHSFTRIARFTLCETFPFQKTVNKRTDLLYTNCCV